MTVPPAATASSGESRPGQREALPDQLRGLALLGIVLVNMPFLAISTAGFTASSTSDIADRATAFLVVALAQGKFYLLFAFLFGYSLTLLLQHRTADGLRRYRRRLLGLAVLGLVHAVFFFIGDILLSYAILGTLLLLFVARSNRTALWAAAVTFAAALVVLGLLAVSTPTGAGLVADSVDVDSAIKGSFWHGAGARFTALPEALVVQMVLNWLLSFSMFLLGLVAGRRGVLTHPERHGPLWRRLLLLAALVGVPGGFGAAWLSFGPGAGGGQRDLIAVALCFATAPALSGGYVALAALHTGSRRMRLVQPAGRMSLTGYLGESILMTAIFGGWGLGLFGEMGALRAALIAVAVWLTLDLYAGWWLRRYRYGPFEWVLRTWSYRGWPPLRQSPRPPTGGHPLADP